MNSAASMDPSRLRFARLSSVPIPELLELLNDPLVLRHMPLAGEPFTAESCATWVAGKESSWDRHGYGPMAFYLGEEFAGWGGLQNEDGDADVGLVLRPEFWGWGQVIFTAILDDAITRNPDLGSVTALLPTTRRGRGVLERLGFAPDGMISDGGVRFQKFRLRLAAPTAEDSTAP